MDDRVGPITRVLKSTRGRWKREGESRTEAGSERLDGAGFEEGGSGREPSNACGSRSWRRQRNRLSLREPPGRDTVLPAPGFNSMRPTLDFWPPDL